MATTTASDNTLLRTTADILNHAATALECLAEMDAMTYQADAKTLRTITKNVEENARRVGYIGKKPR